ncbi:hypothetical protein PLANPX_2708 [Lacipirellula parvula]|uniref:Uncharacterized protein n=1 Tax=Lacipirellula parvula TaxID=2650471 RepID=A0A5K7XFH6_9BACT|nr:hypothetical protein PLANPX_2708 [Lacipirellula parvula]
MQTAELGTADARRYTQIGVDLVPSNPALPSFAFIGVHLGFH